MLRSKPIYVPKVQIHFADYMVSKGSISPALTVVSLAEDSNKGSVAFLIG